VECDAIFREEVRAKPRLFCFRRSIFTLEVHLATREHVARNFPKDQLRACFNPLIFLTKAQRTSTVKRIEDALQRNPRERGVGQPGENPPSSWLRDVGPIFVSPCPTLKRTEGR
jgi:hypothetical protein